MASNLNIDSRLLLEAVKAGDHKTKRSAVDSALKEYVQRRKAKDILAFFGKCDWDESYDYKKERSR